MSEVTSARDDSSAPHLLAARLRLSMVRLSRQLRRMDPSELTIAQFSALATVVRNGPLGIGHLAEIEGLLNTVVKSITTAPNRVRYTMNGFVIAVGSYVKPLLKQAKAAARQVGAVTVDVGDTACKVPLATAYIEKLEAAGRTGQKRKTIRC